jgi:rhamnosyltransferase subunit B
MARPALMHARRQLGLRPAVDGSIVGQWMHSPDGGIALFPDWFGPAKPDWPARVEHGGFPLFDDAPNAPLPASLQRFLAEGSPPVVCMPGSAMQHAERFFAAAVQGCTALGLRCLLLTPHAAQLPRDLPPQVLHLPYAPFGPLLPRAACLLHHGGIGSCAQALRAGLPQIVMPMSHDQFDNGFQLERLDAGRAIAPARFNATRLASTLRALLADTASAAARQRLKARLAAEPALPKLVDSIERLA